MLLADLQQKLKETGRYSGAIDGLWGKLTEAGILLALTDGAETAVADADFFLSGARLGVQPAAIKAFWKTEANGAAFQGGRDKILPEPHRFSKNTAHRFDATNPLISYPHWGERPYPPSQDARYAELLQMVRLDIDAGFASCSYGAPQIMGENHLACGYPTAFDFAEGMARDEKTQLLAFEKFVTSVGILPFLQKVDRTVASWTPVADRYNGTAQAVNHYDGKIAANFIAAGGR